MEAISAQCAFGIYLDVFSTLWGYLHTHLESFNIIFFISLLCPTYKIGVASTTINETRLRIFQTRGVPIKLWEL